MQIIEQGVVQPAIEEYGVRDEDEVGAQYASDHGQPEDLEAELSRQQADSPYRILGIGVAHEAGVDGGNRELELPARNRLGHVF